MSDNPAPEEAIRLLARIAEMHSDQAPDSLVLWCDNAQRPETILTLGHARAIAALAQEEPVGHIDALERAICQERCAQMGEPPCWSVAGEWSNPDCRDPDCRSLACAAIAAWNRRAGGEQEQQLAAWISENSYELAMAVVGAYEMAPNGSGIDHSLAYAGDALMAMIKGECDPLEAVRKVIPAGRLWKEDTHWLPRWQSGEAKVVVDTPSPRAALAGQTEGERNGG